MSEVRAVLLSSFYNRPQTFQSLCFYSSGGQKHEYSLKKRNMFKNVIFKTRKNQFYSEQLMDFHVREIVCHDLWGE